MAKEFVDHLGRRVELKNFPPQRIISLCPSQTETLFALGLQKKVIGRTRFCVHPKPEINAIERVGGTKEVKYERIEALLPDLIVGEKEENTKVMVGELEKLAPVYITEVQTLSDAFQMVRDLGNLGGKSKVGEALAQRIESGIQSIRPFKEKIPCLYFIWRDPWMVAGANTFIDAILQLCGFENVAPKGGSRYPELTPEFISNSGAACILLSSEPYPFQEKHFSEIKAMTDVPVELVDGEMFSWYGSHLLEAVPYLKEKIGIWESAWIS